MEENVQEVRLEDNWLDFENKEPVEGTALYTEVECPDCSSVLLKMKGDGDEDKIKELLAEQANGLDISNVELEEDE
jgi:DNA-directed RNA polymerase subunit RPC12/RpoP